MRVESLNITTWNKRIVLNVQFFFSIVGYLQQHLLTSCHMLVNEQLRKRPRYLLSALMMRTDWIMNWSFRWRNRVLQKSSLPFIFLANVDIGEDHFLTVPDHKKWCKVEVSINRFPSHANFNFIGLLLGGGDNCLIFKKYLNWRNPKKIEKVEE